VTLNVTSGGDLSNLGRSRPPLSLLQSSLSSSLPSRGLPRGSDRARSPAAKHFDAIYSQTAL